MVGLQEKKKKSKIDLHIKNAFLKCISDAIKKWEIFPNGLFIYFGHKDKFLFFKINLNLFIYFEIFFCRQDIQRNVQFSRFKKKIKFFLIFGINK
jgi:hypothetical protein